MKNTNMFEMTTERNKEVNGMSLEGIEDLEIQKKDAKDISESENGHCNKIPPWSKQITVRGLFASFVIGSIYSMIVMKLVLAIGFAPTLNVSAALVSFLFLKLWTKFLNKLGFNTTPFTKQENTVVQTCAVACYSLSMGGGFGSYILGLSKKIYILAGTDMEGNSPGSYKDPEIGWITGFLFATAFVGLLTLVPLRKIMIIDYKLAYPSGTATAVLINGFHTPEGDEVAKKQVRGFIKFFSASLFWGFFQWFYSRGQQCGFKQFPTFGLRAREQTFFFDFNMTYVGAGMICSHLANLSVLLGAVLSWGIMWLLIHGLKGKWYPADIPETSMRSLQGYKVFIPIALILGDGIYQFIKVLFITTRNVRQRMHQQRNRSETENQNNAIDEVQKNEIFKKDGIPTWIVCVGYIVCSIISVIIIPQMFPQVKWYYVVVAYIFAPALGFCNAYGAGLTDMNMSYNYGKIWLFVLAAWAGKDSGVVAGLVGAGIMKSMVSISTDLMHDFKAGYLTNTSPKSMVISQTIGTALGCIIAPLNFYLFFKAFDLGNPSGEYKAPFALIYRNMAILGVEGFSALPQHCLQLCLGFFFFAVVTNLIRDFSPRKYARFMPLPMAMGVPFLVGAYFAVDMFMGSLVVFVWHKMNSRKATVMVPAVASGLICGEGLWILPSSFLALMKIRPPICMKFLGS